MPVRILHCHSTFSLGGKEARAVALMNVFGSAAQHTILSAMPGALGARDAIAPGITVDFPTDAPSLTGRPSVGRYEALARYMRGFDLVLTYNWGAMDAVMARRMFAKITPALVHHEDGFNADEAVKQKGERVLMRRLAFPGVHRVVVPSQTLERVALENWKQPRERIVRIPNGIDVVRYAARPRPNAIPGLKKRADEVVIGTLAGLRPVKSLARLVRTALSIPKTRLVIVGEGPERGTLLAAAEAMGVSDRLVLPGFLAEPARYIGLFDIFALSSDSEQFPISLVEAMAAGLPVAATDVGDVRAILPEAQARYIVQRDDTALVAALRQLVADPALRTRLGQENRAHALASYDAAAMFAAYRALYAQALGAKGAHFAAETL